jgi:hypothetical protein
VRKKSEESIIIIQEMANNALTGLPVGMRSRLCIETIETGKSNRTTVDFRSPRRIEEKKHRDEKKKTEHVTINQQIRNNGESDLPIDMASHQSLETVSVSPLLLR